MYLLHTSNLTPINTFSMCCNGDKKQQCLFPIYFSKYIFNVTSFFFQHVHVHIIPRKAGDFEHNDDILHNYIFLQTYNIHLFL